MTERELRDRSNSSCELCSSKSELRVYEVPSSNEQSILICAVCEHQIEHPEQINVNHWRCLNDSMWSQVQAVQIVVWRMLHSLRSEGWPAELLDMMYMEEETVKLAKSGLVSTQDEIQHIDSNGTTLEAGDTVVLIKDLNVKGAGFTAKRGTAVRRISLVNDNPEHIEGRIEGQQIVILTKFVKKSN